MLSFQFQFDSNSLNACGVVGSLITQLNAKSSVSAKCLTECFIEVVQSVIYKTYMVSEPRVL